MRHVDAVFIPRYLLLTRPVIYIILSHPGVHEAHRPTSVRLITASVMLTELMVIRSAEGVLLLSTATSDPMGY